MTAAELRRKRASLVSEARSFIETAARESRALSDDEKSKIEALKATAATLADQIAQLDEFDADEADESDDAPVDSMPAERSAGVAATAAVAPPRATRSARAPRDHEPWLNPRHPYRLTRAIAAVMEGRALDGPEAETSAELEKLWKRKAQGFFVPHTLSDAAARRTRALDTTAGTGSIPAILGTEFIELMRNKAVVQRAGARVLSDMVGTFGLPKQSAAATAAWVAEGAAPGGSAQTIGQVTFSPKTIAAYTDITRRFVKQTSIDAEAFVREDLSRVIALGLDLAAINGAGSATEPQGLLQNTSVPTVALGANGAAPTWDAIVELETQVANANADADAMAYIGNAKVRGKLKRTLVDSNVLGVFIWGFNVLGQRVSDQVNGYPAFVSNQVPSNLTKGSGTNLSAALFGNFADLIIPMWGPLDILVDPYTGSSAGTVRIVVMQDADVKPRHAESFAKIVDIVTT